MYPTYEGDTRLAVPIKVRVVNNNNCMVGHAVGDVVLLTWRSLHGSYATDAASSWGSIVGEEDTGHPGGQYERVE